MEIVTHNVVIKSENIFKKAETNYEAYNAHGLTQITAYHGVPDNLFSLKIKHFSINSFNSG